MIEDLIVPRTNFTLIDGIYQIMNPEFEKKLKTFIEYTIINNSNDNVDIIEDYEQLPFINAPKHKMDWKLRQEDLINVKKTIDNKTNLSILESGSFNSWLTHHLHNAGHKVVAMDYFEDEIYGLRSKKHYKNNNWLSIQCNLEEVDFLKPCFDLIVLNHGVQFYSTTEKPIRQLKKLLKPGGKLIILGLFIFINPAKKEKEVITYKKEFKERTGREKFMYPSVKGFLDHNDLLLLRSEHIKLIPYKFCLRQNIAAKILTYKPLYYYGIYRESTIA